MARLARVVVSGIPHRVTRRGNRRLETFISPTDDPATVYGGPGDYVVVNDETGVVIQVSDKTKTTWQDDPRIEWDSDSNSDEEKNDAGGKTQ